MLLSRPCVRLRAAVRCAAFALVFVFTFACGQPARAAQLTATWVGAAGGGDGVSYGDPANWDIAQVPVNGGGDTFVVDIPAGSSVTFGIAGAGNQVDQFTLAGGARLTMDAPGRSLEVTGAADIAGQVIADNGALTAGANTSTFTGGVHLFARNGGDINIAAPSFAGTYSSAQTIMEADGTGSTLGLSTLTSFTTTETTSFGDPLTVRAAAGGLIDLSSVVSASSNDQLEFEIQSGGNIDLSALSSTSRVRFDVDVPSYTLAALATAS